MRPSTCACGKPAILRLLNVPYCIDCYDANLGSLKKDIEAFAKRLAG